MTLISHDMQFACTSTTCIYHLLTTRSTHTPDAIAIAAPERLPLSYGRLQQHINEVVGTLPTLGIGRHDRVALVLPQGPEMAVAFLAIASAATCAPLNPAYRVNEFAFYLTDLQAKALIVQAGVDSPARTVAQSLAIPIIELTPVVEAEAGLFTLAGKGCAEPRQGELARPDDVGLVLHTSGTTSRPKIVPLTHTNLCLSAQNIGQVFRLTETDRCLNVMPLFHAHGLLIALLSSLVTGGSVICPPGFYAPQFLAWLETLQPTWYTAAPTIHQAVLARVKHRGQSLKHTLRFIRSSAASLSPLVLTELEQAFGVPVIESYGMTESVQISSNPLPPRARKLGSVGMAAGLEMGIVDEYGVLLAPGETGEVVIRGPSVFQAYENNPTANAQAFINDWFRTGDQGVMDTNGYLFITGRLKELINRGGEKIAPREVDEILMQHPAIAQVATFAVPHPQLGEEVAVAVVLHAEATATAASLQAFTATQLADFKVPRHVLIVDDIPKTPTGKVQRVGLADKLGFSLSVSAIPAQTADDTEHPTAVAVALQEIWTQVLEVSQVGIHESFFQLGGDSILATQLIARIQDAFHIDVSFLTFFETPTVASLARHIEHARQTGQHRPTQALQPLPRHGDLPLSFMQQRLWFLDQLDPGSPTYNIAMAVQCQGRLDSAALEHSLTEIVRRHETLRTTFATVAGRPIQIVAPPAPFALAVVDLRHFSRSEQAAQQRRLMHEVAQQPFDLTRGPLFRATLLHRDTEHLLLLVMHHIVADGWSLGVFWRELTTLYTAYTTGQSLSLPALPLQYADFAHWQRQWLQGETLEHHLAYWQQQLGGNLVPLELPTDRPRPPVQTFRGAKASRVLPGALVKALQQLSQEEGATLFMTLLAAFKALLYRYTGQDDISIGTPIAGRTRVQLEKLIGFFVNTLVLRTNLAGRPTFRELLRRVRQVTLEAFTHQELPFEKLLEALQPERDPSRTPLFQVFFNLIPHTREQLQIPELRLHLVELDTATAKFDLTLYLIDTGDGLTATLNYNTDLFDASTMHHMLDRFQVLLEGIVARPDQHLAALASATDTARHDAAKRRQRCQPTTPFVPFPTTALAQSIGERFARQVALYPQNLAIKTPHHAWTYTELQQRATQVAHTLLARHGLGAERIALFCDHDAPMLASLLGVLQAGKTYVPLDPFSPADRLTYMLEDAQVRAVVTNQRHLEYVRTITQDTQPLINLDTLDPVPSGTEVSVSVAPETLAYMLYTSGSTGRPKGVMQSHRNVLHFIRVYTNNLHISATDRLSLLPSYSFDAAVMDIFGALLNGATLYPLSLKEDGMAPLSAWLHTEAISIYHSTPTVYRYFVRTLADTESFPALRLIVLGGEEVRKSDVELYKKHFLPGCLFINGLGPTESTVTLQYFLDHQTKLTRPGVPVGYPVEETEVILLDDTGTPTEIVGEIAIRSPHIALGYWQQPERTQAAFLPDPTSGNRRIYRTGDLGRLLPDGSLEFLGRKDFQVKIRGYRVEPGEIETLLVAHPTVQEVVVIAREDTPGEKRLVAYMVLHESTKLTPGELREFLRQQLPDYMIPTTFVQLEALPLTPTGKIDRLALPMPERTKNATEDVGVLPRDALDLQLIELWEEVLGIKPIDLQDNFFELGGHSLLAMHLLHHIERLYEKKLPVLTIFQAPTVEQLANILRQEG